jgi:hypothetical protein
MKGRNYVFKTGFDCEGGTKIFETSVTTTVDQCQAHCWNKHADFFSLSNTGGSEFCYCWIGTCSAAPTTAAADKTLYKIE